MPKRVIVEYIGCRLEIGLVLIFECVFDQIGVDLVIDFGQTVIL